MIIEFHPGDEQRILEYAYRYERENVFVIGSLNRLHAFEDNRYFGWEENGNITGLCTWFSVFEDIVIHAKQREIIDAFVDHILKEKIPFYYAAMFRRYAEPVLASLRQHDIVPRDMSEENILAVHRDQFVSFADGSERRARNEDIENIVRLGRILNREAFTLDPAMKDEDPVTEKDRRSVWIEGTFLSEKNSIIVSKANIHGTTKNYVQIGGVITHPEYRRQGYGRKTVSALCNHYFAQGIGNAILFTGKKNEPAINLYASLGFKHIDEFLIADFRNE